MEIILDKSEISCRRESWTGSVRREEMTESVVPDTYPDAARVVDICAQPLIRGKEASAGKVTVTAAVVCTALYAAEETTGLFRMESEIPFTITAEVPDADEESDIVASLELEDVEVRLLNPRKLLFRAELSAGMRCFKRDVLTVSCSASAEKGLHLLERSCTAVPVTEVREKTFVISDEIAMPPCAEGYGRILNQNVSLSTEDVKFVGSRLIFKGTADIRLLSEPGGGGNPVFISSSSSFSQIIELNSEAESAEVTLCLTGAYLNLGENELGKPVTAAELHILAQAAVGVTRTVSYIADAYSNAGDCHTATACVRLPQSRTLTPVRDTYRTLLETPGDVSEVLCAAGFCSGTGSTADGVTGKITVRCLYVGPSGELLSAVHSDALQIDAELPEDVCRVLVKCGEIYAAPAAGGIDVRLPVETQVISCPSVCAEWVTGIELDETAPPPVRPSMYVIPAPAERELWPLAKKYGSTVELIEKNNPEGRDVLIIPVQGA